MQSVLVVGAGPAGLVAAKSLLQCDDGKKFKVTVFEAAQRVGGMWRALPDEMGDKCSPHMQVNLSRYTVTFPDLSWHSVDLKVPVKPPQPIPGFGVPPSSSVPPPPPPPPFGALGKIPLGGPPVFPTAWQVGRYLEAYATKFIPEGVIHLNRRVIAADLVDGASQSRIWSVISIDDQTQRKSKNQFDYLIVASGFFNEPAYGVQQTQHLSPWTAARIKHSSHFREVSSFGNKPGKILVVGGGISGAEAAATAALQISSAKYLNLPGKRPAWSESKVYHVFNRPFYTLPRLLPLDPVDSATKERNLSPHFSPLDLVLYNLAHKGEGPIYASNGLTTPEICSKGHEHITVIAGDQRDTGRVELAYKPDETQYPAFVGITDTYHEFVRSGLIVPVRGRVKGFIHKSVKDRFLVDVASQGPWAHPEEDTKTTIDDVVGIVQATGFRARLDYLSEGVKQALDYDPDCRRVPFLLSRGSIFHPKVPNIAFVGYYEGPFWGVMDMQARVVAHTWAEDLGQGKETATLDISESAAVREAIKSEALNVPQFWMADHLGLVEELSRIIGVQRDDSAFGGQNGPYLSARYQGSDGNEEATRIISDAVNDLQSPFNYQSAAVFRGLQGKWVLERKTDSRRASMLSSTFKGTADFHPRAVPYPRYSDTSDYLYIEDGTLTMSDGLSSPTSRRQIYRYDSPLVVVVEATKDDGLTRKDNSSQCLFFLSAEDCTDQGLVAQGCVALGYSNSPPSVGQNSIYEFRFKGVHLDNFSIKHEVSGPEEDYTQVSWYSRPQPVND